MHAELSQNRTSPTREGDRKLDSVRTCFNKQTNFKEEQTPVAKSRVSREREMHT